MEADGRSKVPPPFEVDTVTCLGCADRERLQRHVDAEPDKGRGKHVVFKRVNPDEYDPSLWTEPSA